MNRLVRSASLALLLGLASSAFAADPGYVDFGRITGSEKGKFVEVTLGKGLLKLAGMIAKSADPEAGKIIAGLSRVRINVVELDQANRETTIATIEKLRRDLSNQGWEQIVTARGRKSEDVAVYLKHQDGEVIEGVVVTVIDETKDEAVLVNIVGQIKAEQLAAIGEHLDIKPLRGVRKEKRG